MSQLSQFNPEKPATHIASLGSESVTFNVEDFDPAVSALVKRQGGGVPKVSRLDRGPAGYPSTSQDALDVAAEVVSARAIKGSGGLGPIEVPPGRSGMMVPGIGLVEDDEPPESEPFPEAAPELVDSTGTSRPDLGRELHARAGANFADREALIAAGHDPEKLDKTFYRRGIHADSAVWQATEKAREFEKMPLAEEGAKSLVATVKAEDRQDWFTKAHHLSMSESGLLNATTFGEPIGIDSVAFSSLCKRMGFGKGAPYLLDVPPSQRAWNVNKHLDAHKKEIAGMDDPDDVEKATKHFRVRTRIATIASPEGSHLAIRQRQAFGVVTPRYTPFDIDKVIEAASMALEGEDARCAVNYDGHSVRFDILWNSTVAPEDYVVGEFFRVGVRLRADDSGNGGIGVDGLAWQNLCLNMIIIGKSVARIASIGHSGDVRKLAQKFREAFATALQGVTHFTKQWGYACREDVIEKLRAKEPECETLTAHEVLSGIFMAQLKRTEALSGALPRRVETVSKLLAMHERDNSGATRNGALGSGVSRASVANAFTRYAHEVVTPGTVASDTIERFAGKLITSPRPFGWDPLPVRKEAETA